MSSPLRATSSRRVLLKSIAGGSGLCFVGGELVNAAPAFAEGDTRGGRLPRALPEALGIDARGILAFVDAVEKKPGGLHSFMLLRRGQVAAEGWWDPYGPRHPHMLYSLSKSFTSTAVGMAVAEGRLKVDQPVVSFFPNELPASVPENLAAMQVRHLLSMGTGHEKDATNPMRAAADGNWVRGFLHLPVEHAPGSRFVYNSAATYMCSAIVQKLTGMPVLEYLRSRLFEPLGFESPTWENCPRGINTGGWGLSIRTEEIARFGQLYLQKGQWNGRQLVPESWVQEATSKQISNGTNPKSDWAQGYGYQFWRCQHGAFRGDGAFGQYCVVMPEQDAVLAITSGLGDMQAVLNAAWEHLLPAMQTSNPRGNESDLRARLKDLQITAPAGQANSPTAKRVSGRHLTFEANDLIRSGSLSFRGARCEMRLQTPAREHQVECGHKSWVRGIAPIAGGEGKVAARGAWTDDNTYTAHLCFYETPYVQTLAWKFDGDQVTLSSRMNVGFGPTQRAPISGRLDA